MPQSEALETDVGLATESFASNAGIAPEEAARRLRLQTVLGERRSQVQQAEAGRVAFAEVQNDPYFAHVVTLTGDEPVSAATEQVLCATPELEVHLGAAYTTDALVADEAAQALADLGFGDSLMNINLSVVPG